MNIRKEYLTVWYGFDGSSKCNPYITRRSSAQKRKVISGVCDYRLYPILEKDADLLLFNTVWDIVMHSDFYDFYNSIDVINSSLHFDIKGCDIAYARPYLFFPADLPRLRFSEKEFTYPYFVGVFYEKGDYSVPMAGLIEEGDGCPMFRAYLVPQWDFTGDQPEIVYRENRSKYVQSISWAINPSNTLQKAVFNLLEYLDRISVDVGDWKERLKTVLEMMKTHANELHILHNVGLYDINALWTLLYQSGHDHAELRKIIRDTERELHRYAMTVVNLIDWKNGGVVNEKDFAKSLLPYELSYSDPIIYDTEPSYPEYPEIEEGDPDPLFPEIEEDDPEPEYPEIEEDIPEPPSPEPEVNDILEKPYFEGELPDNWWNDLGAMERAFKWTEEEQAALDKAYIEGTYGRGRFADDLGAYSELLRSLVRQRLREKAIRDLEAKRQKEED
jgi:hypothetical protein